MVLDLQKEPIDESVLLMGVKNTHQPSKFWVSEGTFSRVLFIIFYVSIWAFVLFSISTHKVANKTSIVLGFSFGLLLLILNDYLYNKAIGLAIDQNTKQFVAYNPVKQGIVMNNKFHKFDKKIGILMKKSAYDKFVKEKKLSSTSIKDFRDNQLIKTFGSSLQENPFSGYEYTGELLLSGSYMFITVMTACIFASHKNIKLFNSLFPYAITSGALAVAVLALDFGIESYSGIVSAMRLKAKFFIAACSFAMTSVLMPFFY